MTRGAKGQTVRKALIFNGAFAEIMAAGKV